MKKLFYLLLLLLFSVFAHAQLGEQGGPFLDAAFGNCDGGCAVQPVSGKAFPKAIRSVSDISGNGLVTAGFIENGSNRDFLALRVNNDGTTNPGFGIAGKLVMDLGSADDEAWGMVVQPNNKIVLAGFSGNDFALVRFESSTGAPDNTFGVNGIVKTDIHSGSVDNGFAVALQSNGKILVAGLSTATGGGDFTIVRYNANGTLDNSFGGGDGIVTTDIGTNTVDVPFSIKLQQDGKILLAGFTATGTIDDFQTTDIAVARYNADGTLDASFDGDGKFTMNIRAVDVATRVDVDAAGRVMIGGSTSTGAYPGNNRDFLLIRLSSAGVPDATFNDDGIVTTAFTTSPQVDEPAYGMVIQADGKIILAGTNDGTAHVIVRYTVDGNPDAEFRASTGTSFGYFKFGYPKGAAADVIITQSGTNVYIITAGNANNDVGLISFIGDQPALVLPQGANLPLNLLFFNAQKQNSNILLQWQTEREENIAGFDIERSADGKNFKAVGYSQPINSNGSTKKNYSFVDNNPLSAVNYYRLNIKDLNGSHTYSKILAIKNNSKGQNLEVFPNPLPVNGGILQIQLPSGLRGRTNLQITDAIGRTVRTMIFETGGNSLATSVDVSSLGKGVYFIRVKSENNVNITTRFIRN